MTAEDKSRYEAWKGRAVVVWAILGAVILVAVCVRAAGLVTQALQLLLAGVVIGFVCSPVTNWLSRRGVPRAVAAFVALALLVVVVVVASALIIPPAIGQVIEILRRVPLYVAAIQQGLDGFWREFGSSDSAQAENLVNTIVGAASDSGTALAGEAIDRLTSGMVENVLGSVNGLVTTLLGLVVGYWLAKDYPAIARELAIVSGPDHERSTTLLLAVVSRSMGGYMQGIVVTSLVNGVGSFVALAVIGHPYASLMGILCGVFHVVPVIGPWFAVLLASAIALFSSPWLALLTLVLTVAIMNVTDNVVSPLVMRSAVKIHPALSLLGIVIGSALGGVLGMALAIPLTAAARSAFVYFFESRTGRQLVSYDGALFRSTPYHDDEGRILPSFDALDDPHFFEGSLLVDHGHTPQARAARRSMAADQPAAERVVGARGQSRARAGRRRPHGRSRE